MHEIANITNEESAMKDEEKNEEIVLESPDHINDTCPTSLSPEPRYPEKGKRQVRDDLALARQLPESACPYERFLETASQY